MADNDKVLKRLAELKRDAEARGYLLNPDIDMVSSLVEGLVENNARYGMETCPCRLLEGKAEDNLDIVCPCDYRDADLAEYGACFCALYVTPETASGGAILKQVPDRRQDGNGKKPEKVENAALSATAKYPVWRCRVCGYLCANTYPPSVCPICKAKKERFELF